MPPLSIGSPSIRAAAGSDRTGGLRPARRWRHRLATRPGTAHRQAADTADAGLQSHSTGNKATVSEARLFRERSASTSDVQSGPAFSCSSHTRWRWTRLRSGLSRHQNIGWLQESRRQGRRWDRRRRRRRSMAARPVLSARSVLSARPCHNKSPMPPDTIIQPARGSHSMERPSTADPRRPSFTVRPPPLPARRRRQGGYRRTGSHCLPSEHAQLRWRPQTTLTRRR